MNFERITTFHPAWDRRNENGKNYGVHGATLRMILKGNKGAFQFVLYTNWFLENVKEHTGLFDRKWVGPIPADVGYHAREPQYEGQEPMSHECEYLDGAPCYYDGSGLQADDVFKLLVEQGSDAVWADLERRYIQQFGVEAQ